MTATWAEPPPPLPVIPDDATILRRPKRSTIFTCARADCQTGTRWFDLACDKDWRLLKESTRQNIERFADRPGTEEYVSQVRKALQEWEAMSWVASLAEPEVLPA